MEARQTQPLRTTSTKQFLPFVDRLVRRAGSRPICVPVAARVDGALLSAGERYCGEAGALAAEGSQACHAGGFFILLFFFFVDIP